MSVVTDHTIVGTAGHIDHGKTALIKALTGIDVDTLTEEKRRGITIELGFAFLDTPGLDREIIFIDVPGHEKLIKTMVAGASNIDAVLFVIAADERINVQTLEHFDILQLLAIEQGVIALTKADLVDETHIRAVTGDIRSMVEGSFLENAPIIPVSSVTGMGVDEIKAALVEVAKKMRIRRDSGVFRMPVDRAFAMQGFGAVIAGTILSGTVNIGDKLEILPDGLISRVRGIQVHAKSVQQSHIGVRTAINLQDVKKEQLRRGQAAVAPGSVTPTTRLDTQLHLLRSYGEDLKNRTRVRFHVGADEVIGRVVLLESDRMAPGQTASVQLVLESPTVALPKDRFVIRTFSSQQTIGGGSVLDAHAHAHKRGDASTVESLGKLRGGLADVVEQVFVKSGAAPLGVSEAAGRIGESEDDVAAAVAELLASEKLVRVSPGAGDDVRKGRYLSVGAYSKLVEQFIGILKDYYSRNHYRVFMPSSDLQSHFTKLAERQVYETLIADLSAKGVIKARRVKVGLADRQPQWKVGERDLAAKIEKMYEIDGYAALPEEEVQQLLNLRADFFRNIMTALTDQGRLVRLSDRVTYHEKYLRSAREFVVDYIREHGGITAGELRDKLGMTRKYAIAILEYLDNAQVTRRLGDKRVLR